MKKLYESKSGPRGWFNVVGVIAAAGLAVFGLFLFGLGVGTFVSNWIGERVYVFFLRDYVEPFHVGAMAGKVIAVGSFLLFGVVTLSLFGLAYLFVRPRPKLYEIHDDKVVIKLDRRREFEIRFDDIELVAMRSSWQPMLAKQKFDRLLARTLFTSIGYGFQVSLVSRFLLLSYRLQISSSKGDVHIRRKSGKADVYLFPWLTKLANVKDFALSPDDPDEFYKQLDSALVLWRAKQSVAVPREKEQNAEQYPRLVVKPTFSLVSSLYPTIWITLMLLFVVGFFVAAGFLSKDPDAKTFTSLFAAVYLLFPLANLMWVLASKKKFFGLLEYRFYSDRLEYGLPNDDWRILQYSDILVVELLKRRYKPIRTIIIRANRVVGEFRTNATTAVFVLDIQDPENVCSSIMKMANDYKTCK